MQEDSIDSYCDNMVKPLFLFYFLSQARCNYCGEKLRVTETYNKFIIECPNLCTRIVVKRG